MESVLLAPYHRCLAIRKKSICLASGLRPDGPRKLSRGFNLGLGYAFVALPALQFGHLIPCPEGALGLSLGFQPQVPSTPATRPRTALKPARFDPPHGDDIRALMLAR
jgi:hypothetical protein